MIYDLSIFRGEISLGDSLGFLGLYVVYIIVVVVGRIINQKFLRRDVETGDQNDLIDNNSVQTFEDPEENPDGPPYISWIRPESISGKPFYVLFLLGLFLPNSLIRQSHLLF